MAGLLAEFLQVESKKDYRFNYHHKYLAPTPQFFPFGFDVDVIRLARQVHHQPMVRYNDQEYPFPAELQASSEKFLKDVDDYMNNISSEIYPVLKNDFQTGLKRFKGELKEHLEEFDASWTKFECELAKANHTVLCEVFQPVDRLVCLEMQITQAEERLDIVGKQRLENDFVRAVEDFCHELFPETQSVMFPDEVMPLAEACIFYESKCVDEWLHLAKYLIKDYLELRIYVMKIPEERLKPEHKENAALMKLLKNFHASVLAAREALAFVAKLPRLLNAKTSDWMTRKLLEPDLEYIQKTAHLGMDC